MEWFKASKLQSKCTDWPLIKLGSSISEERKEMWEGSLKSATMLYFITCSSLKTAFHGIIHICILRNKYCVNTNSCKSISVTKYNF